MNDGTCVRFSLDRHRFVILFALSNSRVDIFGIGLPRDELSVALFDVKLVAVEFVSQLATGNYFFSDSVNFQSLENVPIDSLFKIFVTVFTLMQRTHLVVSVFRDFSRSIGIPDNDVGIAPGLDNSFLRVAVEDFCSVGRCDSHEPIFVHHSIA